MLLASNLDYACLLNDERQNSGRSLYMFKDCITQANAQPGLNDDPATSAEVREILTLAKQDFNDISPEQEKLIENVGKLFKDFNGTLKINGSKKVVQVFNKMRNRKYDMSIPNKEFRVVGFPDVGKGFEMKARVIAKDSEELAFEATTMYDAMATYLDKLAQMHRYARSVLGKEAESIILMDIEKLVALDPDKELKYRFISDGDPAEDSSKFYLRSVVDAKRYKLYDNGLVLYLGLMAVNNYALAGNVNFHVVDFQLTDSKMELYLLENNSKTLKGGVKVETGILISNSEIADGSVRFDLLYKISDGDKTVRLTGDKVLSFAHSWNSKVIKEKLDGLSKLNDFVEDIYSAVEKVKFSEKVGTELLFKIFDKLSHAKSLPMDLKTKIENEQDTANNTETLLSVLSRIEEISSKYGEDTNLFIQAKLHELLVKNR